MRGKESAQVKGKKNHLGDSWWGNRQLADTLSAEINMIALRGWECIAPDPDIFTVSQGPLKKKRVARVYPELKPGDILINGGQLFRFVHEMQNGDYAIYPIPKRDKQLHIGK